MNTILLAFRNIFRNSRRTVFTLLSIIIGVTALVLFDGYIRFTLSGLKESTIKSGVGHLQITTDPKYFLTGSFEPFSFLIPDYEKVAKKLKSQVEVKAVVPQISFSGTLGWKDKSGIVMVTAMPPEQSSDLFSMRTIIQGRELTKRDKNKLILAKGVAEKLDAKTGDVLTLMSATRGGGINAADFEVVGICTLGSSELENIMVYTGLDSAKEFLVVDSVPLLIVVLENTGDTDAFAGKIKNFKLQAGGKDLSVKKWFDIVGYYRQVESLYTNIYNVFQVIILLVVVFSIVNTMMMSVLERVREIGTLRAIGSKQVNILGLFLSEGALIGLLGGILGVLGGLLTAFVINQVFGGIYVPPPPGRSLGYQAYITPGSSNLAADVLISFVVSVLGSLFPAIKAVRLKVADALRFL